MNTDQLPAELRVQALDLYARYVHSFDEGRADELAALYVPDGVFAVSGGTAVHGRAALASMVTASAARGPGQRHIVTSIALAPGPGPVPATIAGVAYAQVVTVAPDAVRLVAFGRYDDVIAVGGPDLLFRTRTFTSFTGAALAGAPIATSG